MGVRRFPTGIKDSHYKPAQGHFVLITHTLSWLLSLWKVEYLAFSLSVFLFAAFIIAHLVTNCFLYLSLPLSHSLSLSFFIRREMRYWLSLKLRLSGRHGSRSTCKYHSMSNSLRENLSGSKIKKKIRKLRNSNMKFKHHFTFRYICLVLVLTCVGYLCGQNCDY